MLTVLKKFIDNKAISKAFAIRTRSSKKGPDKELKYFMLVCARVGKYASSILIEVNTQPTQTIECLARITVGIKMESGILCLCTKNTHMTSTQQSHGCFEVIEELVYTQRGRLI